MSRHEKRRQRLAGLGLLACSAALLALGSDCTAALVFAPLGLWLLFSRQYLLFDNARPARAGAQPQRRNPRHDRPGSAGKHAVPAEI